MFSAAGIFGNDLPDRTVCLTFDDGPGETTQQGGPGPRTLELAQFLASQTITATFFVVGEFVATHRHIVESVANLGHFIGNHTYNHPRLTDHDGEFAADQILKTEQALSGIPRVLKLLRPPQGYWNADIARSLNSTKASSYAGPIMWDIEARDWEFWQRGRSAQKCAEAYIDRIQQVRKGIVLMHDSLFEEEIRSQLDALDMVKLVVGWLQQNAYTIIGIDSVPQVRNAIRV